MRELFRMDRQNYNPDGKVYTRPSSRAIIVKDGKVLLNYIAKHECYEFPGGGIEAGETPEQAMIREVAAKYPVDGFFVDCIGSYPCVCPR